MSEMVERAARAFLAAVRCDIGYAYVEFPAADLTNVMIDGQIDITAGIAAAIAAMREPTEAMMAAPCVRGEDDKEAYQAMIDAALSDV